MGKHPLVSAPWTNERKTVGGRTLLAYYCARPERLVRIETKKMDRALTPRRRAKKRPADYMRKDTDFFELTISPAACIKEKRESTRSCDVAERSACLLVRLTRGKSRRPKKHALLGDDTKKGDRREFSNARREGKEPCIHHYSAGEKGKRARTP